MLRMRLRNLGFSEVSFGSFLVVIFKAQFWFVVAQFWLKNYGPILPRFTVLIFVRVHVMPSREHKKIPSSGYISHLVSTILSMLLRNDSMFALGNPT